jgi:hypothetical protein
MRYRRGIAITALMLALTLDGSVSTQAQSSWDRLQFLVGTWDAKGTNQLGLAEGSTSFAQELNGRVIVRRNFAEYASGPSGGTRHDDLLVIYQETVNEGPHAIYFDSEGHVIRYSIAVSENAATFLSEAAPGPKFRLTYTREASVLIGKFETAMPGEEFKTYLSWTSVKR